MKSWDNEDSISVFVFHVRKVFVPVVTENKTGTFFWDTLYMIDLVISCINSIKKDDFEFFSFLE